MVSPAHSSVSVVVPAYNCEKYLPACIESILHQTRVPDEILIVDDGSTDNTFQTAQAYTKEHPDRIRVLQHPGGVNRGVSATRNLGIRESIGDILSFLDGDDEWLPGKLEVQLEILEARPDVALCYSRYSFIDENGNDIILDGFSDGGRGIQGETDFYFSTLLKECVISVITCTVRKDVLIECGLFPESMRLYEDWLMWLIVTFSHKIYFHDVVFAKYRQHSVSAMHQSRKDGTGLHAEIDVVSTLYRYLYSGFPDRDVMITKYFKRSVRRLFFRARSYGYSRSGLLDIVRPVIHAFPELESRVIHEYHIAAMMPVSIAKPIRYIRRKIIGI